MPLPIVYHPDYVTPLPQGHRFPMAKFQEVYHLLLQEQIIAPSQVHTPPVATESQICRVHDATYVSDYLTGGLSEKAMRRIGLPWSPELVTRTCTAVGGTIMTTELAIEYGLACNTAGGTHHAFPDFGSGFCIFNDMGIAAKTLLERGTVNRILIVDLDVHQGDGTAVAFAHEPRVFTFSMHCETNFPFTKQKSDLDVPLPDGLDDDGYLRSLNDHLPGLLHTVRPDLVIYDAGVDPHHSDRLGKLNLTDAGLLKRDEMVLSSCVRQGIPAACVIGGGYDDDIRSLARRHALLHRAASRIFTDHHL